MKYLIVKSLLLGQPATTSRRLSHFANFCISVKEKVELVVFCSGFRRSDMATLDCYLCPDQWLWAVGSCEPFPLAGCSCSLKQTKKKQKRRSDKFFSLFVSAFVPVLTQGSVLPAARAHFGHGHFQLVGATATSAGAVREHTCFSASEGDGRCQRASASTHSPYRLLRVKLWKESLEGSS